MNGSTHKQEQTSLAKFQLYYEELPSSEPVSTNRRSHKQRKSA